MKRRLLAFLLLALPLAAQDTPKLAPPMVQKLIPLKYADPRTVSDLLRVFEAQIISNTEMHALAVKATPQTMQAIEEAVARLDTPSAAPKNIELTIYLVVGSDGDGIPAGTLPKDLDSVVTQLKNTFPFKTYRELDVMTLRSRSGQRAGTESSGGSMQFGNVSKAVVTNFAINSSSIGADGTTIRLDQVRSNSKIPIEVGQGQYSTQELNLNTDLDIKEGQKVVVGRMGINREQALFLVLTARVVQ
jgi:antitoxin component of RelBE/YafQ-DinJ toxin-antitoxin module